MVVLRRWDEFENGGCFDYNIAQQRQDKWKRQFLLNTELAASCHGILCKM
jgi:hypothetical protein